MNKIICLILSILLLFGGLVACGNVSSEITDPTTNTITIPAATEAPTEPILNADNEYIVADTDEIKFIVKGTPYKDATGNIVINIYAKNQSNIDLRYKINNALINNQPVTAWFSMPVPANSELTSVITFMQEEIPNDIDTFDFTLTVLSENSIDNFTAKNFPYCINYKAVG